MKKSIVIHTHNPESNDVISGTTGALFSFERRETIYPGWIWCTDDLGNQAWVPERFVSIIGETCTLIQNYESKELEVRKGDMVQIITKESGWAWVLDDEGQKGWVPLTCLASYD
jgi:hypothetical protein